ncbi:MAG: hypothetical protein ACP5NV_04390 [Candidatus Woesearchaeota archaeon]
MDGKMRQYLKKTIDEAKYFMKASVYTILSAYAVGCKPESPNKVNYDLKKNIKFSVNVSTEIHSINPILLMDEDHNGLVDKILSRDTPDLVIAVDITTHPNYIGRIGKDSEKGLPYVMDSVQIKKFTEFAKQYIELAYYLDSLQYAQRK